MPLRIFWDALLLSWAQIKSELLRFLVKGMPRRVKAEIEAKDGVYLSTEKGILAN